MTSAEELHCICQDEHRRGYCCEPKCPYSLNPKPASIIVTWYYQDNKPRQTLGFKNDKRGALKYAKWLRSIGATTVRIIEGLK